MRTVCVPLAVMLVVSHAPSPSAQPSPAKPRFEVASVRMQNTKLAFTDIANASPRVRPGGLFTATHTTVSGLILFAYNLRPYQIADGPEWISRDAFEINARAGTDAPAEQIRLMVQSLLEDRFKLVIHTERREMDVLKLVLARTDGRLGPNTQRVEGDCTSESVAAARKLLPSQPSTVAGDAMMSGGSCAGVSQFADFLSVNSNLNLGVPVLDETGLKGGFVYTMRYASLRAADVTATSRWPPFAIALQEQLGLKLEQGRRSIEVFVVDSVEQPTPN